MLYNNYPDFTVFEENLKNLKIDLTDVQKQQFIDYYEMLIEKNKVMNLTAITDFKEVVSKHFIDSLTLIKVFHLENEKILDLGTGAGFPGIPLKIVFPEIDLLLLDSLNKRIMFLDEVIRKLNLNKIHTIHGRAEDIGRDEKYREQFDLCVSRAVAKLSSLSEYCLPFVKPGGYFVSYKSGKAEEELIASEKAFQILGARVQNVERLILPGTDMERVLIVLRKNNPTPKKYPRSAGKPVKEPL